MVCRCGYEFCYSCGGKYGDCDCGVNGFRQRHIGDYNRPVVPNFVPNKFAPRKKNKPKNPGKNRKRKR